MNGHPPVWPNYIDNPRPTSRKVRCEEAARKGTGVGTCNRILDLHGNCDRAAEHVHTESDFPSHPKDAQ